MNDLCSAVNVHYEGLEDGLSTEALKAIPDPTGPVFQEYFKKHESLGQDENHEEGRRGSHNVCGQHVGLAMRRLAML